MDDELKELIKGASKQTKYANSLWVTLIVIASVVVLPTETTPGQRSLPFSLGTIPLPWFYFVATLLLAVLYLAFACAHAQIARDHILTQQVVDRRVASWNGVGTHPRDLYDVAVTPAINRVAPLGQALRGRYQFYATSANAPRLLVRLTTGIYIYLKVLSGLVYYGLPAAALGLAAKRFLAAPPPLWPEFSRVVVMLFLFGVCLALLPLVYLELSYVSRAIGALWASAPVTRSVPPPSSTT